MPNTVKTHRQAIAKSTVIAVEVTGESSPNSKIAALARRLLGKPIAFDGFLSVANSMDKLKIPKGRYARIIITREVSGAGLTVHLDFYRHGACDVGGGGPITRFHARIGDKIIAAPMWGFSIEAHRNQFATCLAAPATGRIDIEYDYWSVT